MTKVNKEVKIKSTQPKKMVNFVSKTLSNLNEELTDDTFASKNYKKAVSQTRQQIAALEAALIDAEELVEDATFSLELAKYPTTKIVTGGSYNEKIIQASQRLEETIAEHNNIESTIKFNKNLLAEFKKLV